jgi:membrane protein
VVLFGAEISFYYQNIETFQGDHRYSRITPYLQKLLALRVAHLLVVNFSQGKKPFTVNQIARTLEMPPPLVQEILTELVESGTVSRTPVKNEDGFAYQPAKAIDLLTIKHIVNALEQKGMTDIQFAQTVEVSALSGILRQFDEVVEQSSANMLLKDVPMDSNPK